MDAGLEAASATKEESRVRKSGESSGRTRRALMDERSISPMPSEWEIDEKLLTYEEKIRASSSNALYLGQYSVLLPVAVKVLKRQTHENHDDVKREFQQELSTLRKVHH